MNTGRHRRAVAALAFLGLCSIPCVAQQTTCFASLQGSDHSLEQALDDDTNIAIGQLQSRLRATGPVADPSRAHLYAMLADAYYVNGETSQAHDAAAAGLAALTDRDGEPLRRRLTLSGIYLLGETGQLEQSAAQFELAARQVPADAPDLACVLEIRGYLRMRSGRIVEAANDLVRAAQLAKERGSERYRLDAESVLSMLYARYGLYGEAHALVAAALAAGLRSHDQSDTANAYFRRGDVYLLQGNLAAAEADFRRSAAISRDIGQPLVAAQADERLCTTLSATTRHADARTSCRAAIRETIASRDPESTKVAYAALGKVELGDGHPRLALGYLNRALSGGGAAVPPHQQARFRQLRAQARALLGDTRGALEDTNAYLQWSEAGGARHEIAQMAMARAQSEVAIEEQKAGRLRAEADEAKLAASQARLLANMAMLAAALFCVLVLSGWWFWRRRRDVARVRQAAAERFASIGTLTAGIAHEFNNQLTVMEFGLSALDERPAVASDPAARMLLRELRQSTQASAGITAQLRSFGRQQQLFPQAIALDSFFERIKPLLDRIAGERVRVHLETGTPTPAILADESLLTEVLVNLVSNARDALPNGGTVTVGAESGDDAFTTIRVSDPGVGMSPEVLARATGPFFTTKPVGSGIGLGLSMVEGFVSQSGGAMQISSDPVRGTCVILRLPNA